jgi:hypothetical protein
LVFLELSRNLWHILYLVDLRDIFLNGVSPLSHSERVLLLSLLLNLSTHLFNHRNLTLKLGDHSQDLGVAWIILVYLTQVLQVVDVCKILHVDFLHIFAKHPIVDVIDVARVQLK